MEIHEYQAQAILSEYGIAVPRASPAMSPEEAGRAFNDLRAPAALVKAQVHAGGRGKSGGVVKVSSRAQAEAAAARRLGTRLVTRQTGPRGLPVHRVLVQEFVPVEAEHYASLSLDRETGRLLVMASARGGVEIEDLARSEPAAIVREYGHPLLGVQPFQARKVCVALGVPQDLMRPVASLIMALATAFVSLDASLIELNPLGRSGDRLLPLDVKMAFDDNALARHPRIADLRDPTQEDPREVEARRADLSYVGLDGTIGCMVNGAGLAMATLDLIRHHGGEPANFLDVGGDATAEKVAAALRILCADARVRAILINIFGGIVRCDVVAQGVLEAARGVGVNRPLVVRLEGTRAAEGRALLAQAALDVTPADSLEEAAAKAVERARR